MSEYLLSADYTSLQNISKNLQVDPCDIPLLLVSYILLYWEGGVQFNWRAPWTELWFFLGYPGYVFTPCIIHFAVLGGGSIIQLEGILDGVLVLSRLPLRPLTPYIRGAFNQECESIHKIRMNKVIEVSNNS